MRAYLARFCFAMLLTAGLTHGSTYLGFDPITWCPPLMSLHVAAMLAAASTILSGHVRVMPMGSSVLQVFDEQPSQSTTGMTAWDEAQFARVVRPNRRKLFAGAFAAYALVNFVVCLAILQGGQPGQRGDAFVLVSHGRVTATLTQAQYRWDLATQTRLVTGHRMLFFYLSGALWSLPRRRAAAR